ncbi:beta-lactamase/transpeptidase-like protein [Hypoxylon trugodes]|uniref:beta-lactamase/transpeptidase-like protein n=1 Tax=Hypoxylon trugodes TaxID=326681 RepID=UPI00219084A8|nr:beta-lactamase/transpeptidase-like protein [Hypoxylon trugodes]KAI1390023.1 beta-lactamase/transpeptidase-like protein [Hypoxylon trugodes]
MKLTQNILGACPLLVMFFSDALAAKNNHCPPLGAVLPAPTSPSSHPAVQSAVGALKEAINGITGSFNSTAISIGVKSLHETEPLVDLHYTPPQLDSRGAQEINASTIYRLASISKVFLTLAALKTTGISMNDPITKYVPRLRDLQREANGTRNSLTVVDWDDVTIEALASHMGGISSDVIDMTGYPADWTQVGLPEARETLKCAGVNGLTPCTAEDFWNTWGKHDPVFAPFSKPLYSNTAFFIISLAIEAASGRSFDDVVQKEILDVAGLTSTSLTKPDDKIGAISVGDLNWNASFGTDDPAGGYYSSTKDLLAFGEAILSNKLLSPAQTRRWLKPVTFTSSLGLFIGAPWEIGRSDNITSDKRLVEFYSKGGDAGAFHTIIALVPDYDLVVTVMGSGPESDGNVIQVLFSQIIQALLGAIETAGKDDATAAFAGTYLDEATNSTITLAVDDEGPGLGISNWTVRGVDVPSHWAQYFGTGDPVPETYVSTRLYPTGLTAGSKTSWRVGIDIGTPEDISQADALLFWPQGSCISWGTMDRATYQFKAIDEMFFSLDQSGAATSVEFRGFQATLKKVQSS